MDTAPILADSNTFSIFLLVLGCIGILIYSILMEVLQSIRPDRYMSFADLVPNFLGILVAYFSNAWIVSHSSEGVEIWSGLNSWRVMFGAEVFPALLFFALLLIIPESPRWLTIQGMEERAIKVLSRISTPEMAVQTVNDIKQVKGEKETSFFEIFRPGIRTALLAGIGIAVLSQLSGINAVIYYGVKILDEAGFGLGDALGGQVIIGIVNFLFTFLAIWKIDKMGRKPLLIGGVLCIILSHLVIGFLFFKGLTGGFLLLGFLLLFVASFAATLGPISWVVVSEIFPVRIRGRVLSLATLGLWAANAILMQLVPWLLETITSAGTFWLFAIMSIPTLWIAWKILPETKGRTLEEIEQSWNRSTGSDDYT